MKLVLRIVLIYLTVSCVQCFRDQIKCKNNETLLSRPRRYLDFLEQTRIFFRVNYKVNVLTWGALWAHASGWKANMNLLNDNKALRPFRRDTYDMLRKLLNYQGFDGQACILKAFCTATRTPDGDMANGMLFKLLRHLFTMKFVFIVSISCLSILIWNVLAEINDHAKREKRYLDFMKSTRMFFRMNIAYSVLMWGNILSHGLGFKANMNMLNDKVPLRPFRRDTYETLHRLFDLHGFDGQACLLKAFCIATRDEDASLSRGFLYKMLRHLFQLNEHDRKHFSYLKDENCDQILHHHCPLSFNSISPFTDDV